MAETRPPRTPDRTLGSGHDTFWDWCGKRELRLQHCTGCGAIAWPVVKACEQCGGDSFDWPAMSGRGKVISWCTFERDYYYGMLPIPWDTILVELEEGPLFISNPQGFGWRDITPDMPVKLAFRECEDKAGVYQLPVFGPA